MPPVRIVTSVVATVLAIIVDITPIPLSAQPPAEPTLDPAKVDAIFSSGSRTARMRELGFLLSVPDSELAGPLVRRLAGELVLANAATEKLVRTPLPGTTTNGGGGPFEEEDDYYPLLIQVVARSRDPQVIDALVGAIDTGAMASDAVAKFGDEAVGALVAIARSTPETAIGPPKVMAALLTLERMIAADTVPALSSASRSIIASVAGERLQSPRGASIVLTAAARLATATGDATLRDEVSRLAADIQTIAARGIADPQAQLRAQLGISDALRRHP